VRGRLADLGIALPTVKDHVVFERGEILTASGTPYGVFTPYKNSWLRALNAAQAQGEAASPLRDHAVAPWAGALTPVPAQAQGLQTGVPSLAELGFQPTNLHTLRMPAGCTGAQELLADFLDERIDRYHDTRNFPAVKGPSYLSTHLRFGTVSVRQLAREAWSRMQAGSAGAEVWLSELIWRDFYHQVLWHHPHVATQAFRPEYDRIVWDDEPELFTAWREGRTGYPLVDAAMLQLNQSGYMHNRLRMVVASFLTKDLGIAEGKFIRRYVPELAGLSGKAIHAPWLAGALELQAADVTLGKTYPHPIVDHAEARAKTLERYAVVKKKAA